MELSHFITTYDKPNTIVLLEGKRIVASGDKDKIIALSQILTKSTKHIIFRSGNAGGADNHFSNAFHNENNIDRFEVVVPYNGHRRHTNSFRTINLEELELTQECRLVVQSKSHKSIKRLIELYISGQKNKLTYKAAYILRDTLKVLGMPEIGIQPASFALFYDDSANPRKGGTGHTMNICDMNGVPYITQDIWMKWLDNIV